MAPHHAQHLRIVPPAVPGDGDVEAELAALFVAEDALTRQLLVVRTALQGARERFADDDGALMLPRMELLRTRYGPKEPPR